MDDGEGDDDEDLGDEDDVDADEGDFDDGDGDDDGDDHGGDDDDDDHGERDRPRPTQTFQLPSAEAFQALPGSCWFRTVYMRVSRENRVRYLECLQARILLL